jgi:thymidylate kinase
MLITFSAIDGAGKTTQIDMLKSELEQRGHKVRIVWSRGGYTPRIQWLKDLARRLAGKRLPSAGHSAKRDAYLAKGWISRLWLVLAILDLAFLYGLQLRWWRAKGECVLCDRFLWDTAIDYRLMFRNVAVENWWLWRFLVWTTPKPDTALALLISFEESIARCLRKYDPFPDPEPLRRQRYDMYRDLFARAEWTRIDATRPIEVIARDIFRLVSGAKIGSGAII